MIPTDWYLPYHMRFGDGTPPSDAHLNPFSCPSLSVTVSSPSLVIYRKNDGLIMELVGFTINIDQINVIPCHGRFGHGRTTPWVLEINQRFWGTGSKGQDRTKRAIINFNGPRWLNNTIEWINITFYTERNLRYESVYHASAPPERNRSRRKSCVNNPVQSISHWF